MFPALFFFQQTPLYTFFFFQGFPFLLELFRHLEIAYLKPFMGACAHGCSSFVSFALGKLSPYISTSPLQHLFLVAWENFTFLRWFLFYGYFDFFNLKVLLQVFQCFFSQCAFDRYLYYVIYYHILVYPFSFCERCLFAY